MLATHSAAGGFLDETVGAVAAAMLSPSDGALTGQRVNGLDVGSLLGVGGMGEVYKAHDSRLGRDVAIKVLPPSFAADPDRLRRFEQEARAAGVLNHPNITGVYDLGTAEDGSPYVVQELREGPTLRAALALRSLPAWRTAPYAAPDAPAPPAAPPPGCLDPAL